MHNATFTIKTDYKPLKYILDAPMQNKKIQLRALSIAGYNCKVEYIEGRYKEGIKRIIKKVWMKMNRMLMITHLKSVQ